jgi:RNA polymerase sigma-70 factor (ECF subfamily)
VLHASIPDPERFEEIFERHFESVHRYTCRRTGAAGEDLAAQTFLIAFSVRASFDGRLPSARPWLFGIAHNLVLHHIRDERTRLAMWKRLPRETEEPDHADPERLDAMLAGVRIERALRALPALDREVFLLAALSDLTYREIAATTGLPIGTVRSKLSRARTTLRERLAWQVETAGADSPASSRLMGAP